MGVLRRRSDGWRRLAFLGQTTEKDAWLFQGPDGSPAKIELSTRRDGKVDRTEFYSKGELTRVEADTDADGRIDKWETYIEGVLATVSFDPAKSGKPTITIDYRKEK